MIDSNDDGDSQRLCSDCVEDQFLRQKILCEGEQLVCSFCEESGKTFSLEQVADLVEAAFEAHFERTSVEPSDWEYLAIREFDHDWDRDGEQVHYVISEIAGIDENIAEEIVTILSERHSDWDSAAMGEESEFDAESHYVRKTIDGHGRHAGEWSAFERRLQLECRFLSRASQGILDEVFAGIDGFLTREGQPVIRVIGPESDIGELYRARVFQSSEGLVKGLERPDNEVGPPPLGKASAGRMNAQGISVFYGALDPDTALAEVRPPVGSDVVVAKFEILRPIRVLDISALKRILVRKSYFDPDHGPLLERVSFLKELSGKITRPAMPEREHIDYLVTQVIADYLASEHRLDGLIYPSVQVKDGVNIVVFHHACRTEELSIPEGTKIQVGPDGWSEDGPDPDFLVTEICPPQEEPAIEEVEGDDFDPLGISLDLPDYEANPDFRGMGFRICVESIEVRSVLSVAYKSHTSSVRRERKTI